MYFLLLALSAFGVFIVLRYSQPNRPQPSIPAAPEPAFSPPGKQQPYSISYVSGLRIVVNRGETVYSHQALGNVSFIVEYENLRNSNQTYPRDDSLDIGCIYAQNTYFRDKMFIFSDGNFLIGRDAVHPMTSLKALTSMDFGAYEKKTVTFGVHGSCRYIGTRDGVYWWRVE